MKLQPRGSASGGDIWQALKAGLDRAMIFGANCPDIVVEMRVLRRLPPTGRSAAKNRLPPPPVWRYPREKTEDRSDDLPHGG